MKARPRKVENRVAEELTKWSAERGDHWVFERRPAMGREGPDIEYPNPYKFAIDVKSRKSISKKYRKITDLDRDVKWWLHRDNLPGWYVCRLDSLDTMFKLDYKEYEYHSVVVQRWLDKMRDWGRPEGYTGMIVLHRPRKSIDSCTVVVSVLDWLNLMEAMGLI